MIEHHHNQMGIEPLCQALDVPKASFYRSRTRADSNARAMAVSPKHALSEGETQSVLDLLHSERFRDLPPTQIYPILLEEGRYMCSVRTMYRILAKQNEVRERRNVRNHPVYAKPELLATGPNQVWSWDITKLKGPVKWSYYHLYVILDIFSRYVVGWMIAPRESATLAKRLITESCMKQNISEDQLVLHADRGSSMKSKVVAQLLADLGVTKTHSRPHVSNDNPFSESQFKTMKYRPEFPSRFGCLQDARAFAVPFFNWYNQEHRHSGIGLYTPSDVHHGRTGILQSRRQATLDKAYLAHPERFVRKKPQASSPPEAVWINPPDNIKIPKNCSDKIRA